MLFRIKKYAWIVKHRVKQMGHVQETGEGAGVLEGGPSETNQTRSGNGQRQGMLAVNDLNYVLAPDLSVSVNNTFKNHFFQSSEYTDTQRAICILNSGADYADTRSSTLNFAIELTASTDSFGYFGKHGSVLNCIKNIAISSRSGDEISRVTDLNHLSAMTNGFKYSKEWIETVGGSIGYGECLYPPTHAHARRHFSIPLYLLSDFFGYGRLMPAMVLAGLRIEIEWEYPKIAFQAVSASSLTSSGGGISSYKISNPYISLRSVQLTDGTQRALNEMSAVNGLEIVYCDHERTESVLPSGGVVLNLEVRKAASRALKAYASIRTNHLGADDSKDSFRTEKYDYLTWQWQLGSLYFPQQPVKALGGIPRASIPESYNQTLVTFNTLKGDQQKNSAVPMQYDSNYLQKNIAGTTDFLTGTSVTVAAVTGQATGLLTLFQTELSPGDQIVIKARTYTVVSITSPTIMHVSPPFAVAAATDFYRVVPNGYAYDGTGNSATHYRQPANPRLGLIANGDGLDGTFANGRSTITCLLERSDLFNLTGVPINNSRVLSLRADFATGQNRICTIFLKYVRLARVFLNNVEVEQ